MQNSQTLQQQMLLLLVACDDDKLLSEGVQEVFDDSTEVQKDFLKYMNEEIPSVESDEMEVLKLYSDAVGADYVNDDVLQDTIEKEVLPAYTEFIAKIDAIKPKTDEVKDLHDVFYSAHKTQFTALEKVVVALEKQDENLINDANKLLEEGQIKIKKL